MRARAKERRRHVQRNIEFRRDKNGQRRRGRDKRKGRKCKVPGRPSERHMRRPEVDPSKPLHVTLRVADAVGYLRKPHLFKAIRIALWVTSKRDDFRIVHFSVQGNHLHLIVEAKHRKALWTGMKGFQISAAKHINGTLRRRGIERVRNATVFPDRYNAKVITSVRHLRNTLNYVLNNWRHHNTRGETLTGLFDNKLDPYSSAVFFPGWKERTVAPYLPPKYDPPKVCRPETWLLSEGWKRAAPISVWEVPSPH